MKNVFNTTDQAIHVWAQQNQHSGRCGNVSFEEGYLFSYNTAIARIMKAPMDLWQDSRRMVALISSTTYSSSTSVHQAAARNAASHYHRFYVKFLGNDYEARKGRAPQCSVAGETAWVEANMADYSARYNVLVLKGARARLNAERYLNQAAALRIEASNFAACFNGTFVEAAFPGVSPGTIEAAKVKGKQASAEKAAATKIRCAEAARVLQSHIDDYLINGGNFPHSLGRSGTAAQIASVLPFMVNRWRARLASFERGITSGVYLRLSLDGTRIETSAGAEFPVADALKAFQSIALCRRAGVTWDNDGSILIRLGHFKIDGITAAGDVKAGCHNVKWDEIERIARELGALPVTA